MLVVDDLIIYIDIMLVRMIFEDRIEHRYFGLFILILKRLFTYRFVDFNLEM